MSDIMELPNELLLMIFDMLPMAVVARECAKVCRRWAWLAGRWALAVRAERHVDRVGRATRALLVLARGRVAAELLVGLAWRAPFLTQLTVSAAAPLANAQLAALRRLPHLTHLDVFAGSHVLRAQELAGTAGRLEVLVINDTTAPRMLRALAESSRLRELHMYGRAVHYPRRELQLLLQVRGCNLRELTLRCHQLLDGVYRAIGACLGLETLRLYSCLMLLEDGARALTGGGARLRRLHVTGAPLLRSGPLGDMLRGLRPGLEELVLSATSLGDEHVELLAEYAPSVRVLEAWSTRLSAEGVVRLALALRALTRLDLDVSLAEPQLRRLAAHPALQRVRCAAADGLVARATPGRASLLVESVEQRFSQRYFRSGAEGYRGALYYHWTVDLQLQPVRHDHGTHDSIH